MKRLAMLILTGMFLMVPARAGADDGGWWDWLWKWDQRFIGASSEIHLVCLDQYGRRVEHCEEWWTNLGRFVRGKPITHKYRVLKDPDAAALTDRYEALATPADVRDKVDFRFGYGHSVGDRYSNSEDLGAIGDSINVLRLMGMYYRYVNRDVAIGAGVGYLTIWGDRFDVFSRGIFTPLSVIIHPFPGRWKVLALRPEVNYIAGGFKAADFGDDATRFTFSKKHEWNVSIAIGVDFSRVGTVEPIR